ncbi:MAG: AraC family transcriptional regulator [Bacteroidales bacterium]|nr:AraC family transcriptional regulator [Bacteroidales bacterium]
MKIKISFSFYRAICLVSVVCLLVPLLSRTFRQGGEPFVSDLDAGLLGGCSILLLLPIPDEYVRVSFYYSLVSLAFCLVGALVGIPAQDWLPGMLIVLGVSLLSRSIDRYRQLQPLFRTLAVWHNVENHARLLYSLALFLLVALLFSSHAGALWQHWVLLPFSLALYGVLFVRVHTGRTCFLRPAREKEIKDLIHGNLRSLPAQADPNSEELARMSRLYGRVISVMEQKQPYLDEGFSLDDLAGEVYTNRSYLSRTINVLSGRNFSQFVNYFRIRYGVELLRKDPHLRIFHVAQMCGFHSSPSFNAAFKVNMGETPSDYQERLRSERFVK